MDCFLRYVSYIYTAKSQFVVLIISAIETKQAKCESVFQAIVNIFAETQSKLIWNVEMP